MKKTFKLISIIALVAVIGLSMAACGGEDDNNNTTANPTSAVYIGETNDAEYKLEIGAAGSRAAFSPKVGDTYTLTVTFASGNQKTSTGTVTGVNPLTLQPSNSAEPFTVTLENGGIKGMNGTITFTDGTNQPAPPALEPVTPPVGTAPAITTTALPGGTVGTAYSQPLTATGDTPITWSIDSGSLPNGLTLSAAGVISGTPTTANTFNFTVKAANAAGSGTKALSIVIAASGGGGHPAALVGKWYIADQEIYDFRADGTMAVYTSLALDWSATSTTITVNNSLAQVTGTASYSISGSGTSATLTLSNISGSISNPLMAGTYTKGSGGNPSPSGMTWTSVTNSPFGSESVEDIAYGGGRWVAVGVHGGIAYSDDGASWTAVADSPFGTTRILAVAYGGGRFVAVGLSCTMAYSDDGASWTAVENIPSAFSRYSGISAVAYGGGRWIAVGDDVMTLYSDDGASWTAVNSGHGWGSACIAYGNNRWISVTGGSGKMKYSADNGATWTAVADSTFGSSTINAVAYLNNRWVAVGGSGKMATSADGVTWTAVADSFGTATIHDIAYGGGRWVIVGDGYSLKMATSANGTSWTEVTNSTFGYSGVYGIAYGGGRFVAVGSSGIAYSDD